MRRAKLSGQKRKLTYFLGPLQQKMLDVWVPKVPLWLNSTHLVLLTIPSCVGAIVMGYLARGNKLWIMGIGLFVLIQYITDAFDGAVGRYRKEGYVLWGFYMDHFMDFFFACSLVAAYSAAYRLSQEYFLSAALITSGFFIHEYLLGVVKGSINTAGYYGFGPTELRVVLIMASLVLPFIPSEWVTLGLRVVIQASFGWLIFLIIRAQLRLRKEDMRIKSKGENQG